MNGAKKRDDNLTQYVRTTGCRCLEQYLDSPDIAMKHAAAAVMLFDEHVSTALKARQACYERRQSVMVAMCGQWESGANKR